MQQFSRSTLLTVISKMSGRVIINRTTSALDRALRKEHAGYRQGMFILRKILEQ